MVREDVLQIIRKALELPKDFELDEATVPEYVPGWDSIGWINVISEVEDAMGTEIEFDELEQLYNVGHLCDLVTKMKGDLPIL